MQNAIKNGVSVDPPKAVEHCIADVIVVKESVDNDDDVVDDRVSVVDVLLVGCVPTTRNQPKIKVGRIIFVLM